MSQSLVLGMPACLRVRLFPVSTRAWCACLRDVQALPCTHCLRLCVCTCLLCVSLCVCAFLFGTCVRRQVCRALECTFLSHVLLASEVIFDPDQSTTVVEVRCAAPGVGGASAPSGTHPPTVCGHVLWADTVLSTAPATLLRAQVDQDWLEAELMGRKRVEPTLVSPWVVRLVLDYHKMASRGLTLSRVAAKACTCSRLSLCEGLVPMIFFFAPETCRC